MTRYAALAITVFAVVGCSDATTPALTPAYRPNLLAVGSADFTAVGIEGHPTRPVAISNTGLIAGEIGLPPSTGAFTWESGFFAKMPMVTVSGLNDAGVIVGACDFRDPSRLTPCYQDETGFRSATELPSASYFVDVNNSGQFLIMLCAKIGSCVPVVTDKLGGFPEPMATLSKPVAYALNDLGEAVGSRSEKAGGQAIIWRAGGGEENLGNFGGVSAEAVDINNLGQVLIKRTTFGEICDDVRCAKVEAVTGHVWENGVLTSLGTLGGTTVVPVAINDNGQAVGMATDATGESRAFHWHEGVISTFGSNVKSITDINNLGEVVGTVGTPDGGMAGRWRITLAPPTPEAALEELSEEIADIVSEAGLPASSGEALLTKVDAAVRMLNTGKTGAAANVMNAFINQVNALVRSGRLPAADGETLTGSARAAIQRMNG